MTLEAFAKRVGCHFTMASRIRSGQRLPSGTKFLRIVREFDLDYAEAAGAYEKGAQAFGRYMRATVFAPDKEEVRA